MLWYGIRHSIVSNYFIMVGLTSLIHLQNYLLGQKIQDTMKMLYCFLDSYFLLFDLKKKKNSSTGTECCVIHCRLIPLRYTCTCNIFSIQREVKLLRYMDLWSAFL